MKLWVSVQPFEFEVVGELWPGFQDSDDGPGEPPWFELQSISYNGKEIDTTRYFNDEFEEALSAASLAAAEAAALDESASTAFEAWLDRRAA